MCSLIRQEVLSGIRFREQFEKLESRLTAFPDEPPESTDFVEAARCCHQCLGAGVKTEFTDFLICAMALRLGVRIFKIDKDFGQIAKVLPTKLHKIDEQNGAANAHPQA